MLNNKKYPNTQKNYQSELDLFLQTFNKNRTTPNPSAQLEKEKAAYIAEKRDNIT